MPSTRVRRTALVALLASAQLFTVVTSFSVGRSVQRHSTELFNGNDPSGEKPVSEIISENDNENDSLEGFNPFDRSQQTKKVGYDTTISLRQTTMKRLTDALIDIQSVQDEESRKIREMALLEEYRDVILEPLDNMDAVLEPGSIYTPDMPREERYSTYLSSIDERIWKAKNMSVRNVLQTMRDYVEKQQ